MKRVIIVGVLGLLALIPTGCIAVSAKEVSSGMRYEAVTTPDGKIYVIDTKKRTARPVRIVVDADCDELE